MTMLQLHKIADEASTEAKPKLAEIEHAARFLGHLMQQLHGDPQPYRIHIDHDCEFVLVRSIPKR